MSEKPAFMIYHRDMKALAKMPSKDLGDLIKALYAVSLGEDPEPPKKNAIIFDMMAERVREDAEAYERKVERNRNNANARWKDKNATASDGMQPHATAQSGTQYNTRTIQDNNKNNNNTALAYSQRTDDMNDVLMEV